MIICLFHKITSWILKKKTACDGIPHCWGGAIDQGVEKALQGPSEHAPQRPKCPENWKKNAWLLGTLGTLTHNPRWICPCVGRSHPTTWRIFGCDWKSGDTPNFDGSIWNIFKHQIGWSEKWMDQAGIETIIWPVYQLNQGCKFHQLLQTLWCLSIWTFSATTHRQLPHGTCEWSWVTNKTQGSGARASSAAATAVVVPGPGPTWQGAYCLVTCCVFVYKLCAMMNTHK